MCAYFKTETDVAQNLIDDVFSNFDCQKILSEKICVYEATFLKNGSFTCRT